MQKKTKVHEPFALSCQDLVQAGQFVETISAELIHSLLFLMLTGDLIKVFGEIHVGNIQNLLESLKQRKTLTLAQKVAAPERIDEN